MLQTLNFSSSAPNLKVDTLNYTHTHNHNTPKAVKATTILSQRNYKRVCIGGILIFFLLYGLLGYNKWISSSPICKEDYARAQWTRDFSIAICGAFLVAVCLQLNRISLSIFREENDIGTLSSYYASLSVNVIAATSHFCTLLFNWGGTCRDAFGLVNLFHSFDR